MLLPTPNPIAFSMFGLSVRWYGILIAIGMLIGMIIAYKRAPRHDIQSERVIDLVLVSLPAGVIGSRLYYVIFHWESFRHDLGAILNIRLGGLAIHGGLFFGLATAIIFCFLWSIRPMNLLDLMAPSIALAQSIGRWGNYFNKEAHGGPTDLPWAILINGEAVHPTFLYESIWCLFIFFILIFIDNRRKFEGQVFLLYGIFYSIERFFVEGLRTDSLMLGSLRMAQVVSVIIFMLFLIFYIKLRKNRRRKRIFY